MTRACAEACRAELFALGAPYPRTLISVCEDGQGTHFLLVECEPHFSMYVYDIIGLAHAKVAFRRLGEESP